MSRKKYLTIEEIREVYFNKGVNMVKAAQELGCSVPTLRRRIKEYGFVPKEKTWNRESLMAARFIPPTKIIPKEQIMGVYINQPISLKEAVTKLGTSMEVLVRSMRAQGIPPKTKHWNSESRKSHYPILDDKDRLKKELETKSIRQVARENGCTSGAVVYFMEKYGFQDDTKSFSDRIKDGLAKSLPEGQSGSHGGHWKGGKKVTKQGYVQIYSIGHPFADGDGYVMRHRLAMEKKIGRFLRPEEVVHHVNNCKGDDRIENLELLENQGAHTKLHFEMSKRTGVAELESERLKAENESLKQQLAQLQPNL